MNTAVERNYSAVVADGFSCIVEDHSMTAYYN